MKRLVITTVLKICGKALLLTIAAGIVIAIVGNMNGWNTSIAYSNAFFIAGCLVIIGGASSRLGAGQQWSSFQLLSAESFRNMSSAERANFILDASSSVSLVILGVLSGMMLFIISWLVTKMF